MRAFLQRRLDGSLAPACETSERIARKLGVGEAIEVDIKTRNTRSVAWHKKYWALCTLIYSNVERIKVGAEMVEVKSPDHVHMLLKLKAGLFDAIVKLPDGTKAYVVKSISFDEMTADEWAAAWQKIIDVVHRDILPTVSEADLENEIAKCAA